LFYGFPLESPIRDNLREYFLVDKNKRKSLLQKLQPSSPLEKSMLFF